MARYGMTTTLKGSIEAVRSRVTDALKAEGFGILTEIDVQKTLKEKIGAELEPYLILGACNPKLAHQALSADRSIGLLLPCNVTLRAVAGGVEVSILDPEAMFSVVDDESKAALGTLPAEAKRLLTAAVRRLDAAQA